MSPLFTTVKDIKCALPYLFLKPKYLTRIIRNAKSVSSLFFAKISSFFYWWTPSYSPKLNEAYSRARDSLIAMSMTR